MMPFTFRSRAAAVQLVVVTTLLLFGRTGSAQEAGSGLPDFGGCLWCRPKLTGNWCGMRPCLAQSGITLDADVTQFYQGVTGGGRRQRFKYGGHGDYVVDFDFGKLGVQEGLFLKLRAEHRFGENVNRDTGAILPVALAANLPVSDREDLYLTDVLFTQALSESFIVFLGKTDTLDGEPNAFAQGRGTDQFCNAAFVFNPALIRTMPYSTLATGFALLEKQVPWFTFTVLNATDTVKTSGFRELFANGVALVPELRIPVTLFGLPGHQLFGGSWSSRDFVALGQDPRIIIPGGGVPIARKAGSWALFYNFDQYLHLDPHKPTRGWGAFGRAAISDGNPNPLKWFLSFGVGGNSPLRARENDSFGIGWYYAGVSDELGPLLNLHDGQGIEFYYNVAVTPWFHLTPDLQIIEPARPRADTALVFGLRAKADF